MDRAVTKALKSGGNKQNKLQKIWGCTLYHREDVPYAPDLSDLPDGFTPFRNKVESKSSVRAPLPPPSLGQLPLPSNVDFAARAVTLDDLPFANAEELAKAKAPRDPRSVLPFDGGETAALARVKYYVWESERIATYFETRNGMLGGDYSSKLAPWLAHGCISPRLIAAECGRYERERVKNKSTYWLVFELIWRDFYKFFQAKHGDKVFKAEGITNARGKKWRSEKGSASTVARGATRALLLRLPVLKHARLAAVARFHRMVVPARVPSARWASTAHNTSWHPGSFGLRLAPVARNAAKSCSG